MKYSYNWLKELSKTKKSPKQLAELLTMRAFELEEMSAIGGSAYGRKKGNNDIQLEFAILPNRAHDMLSHIGMAWEICAVEGRKLANGGSTSTMEVEPPNRRLKIKIKDKKLCPRYIGAVLENIKVSSSPKWMQERLLVCGIKPINNIVDITNYVMLETGQPLHAFDASKIKDQRSKINIVVRKPKNGEKIKLLDEKEYQLSENNLVIADTEKALALAGVMGGAGSGVTNKTTSIILESANFNSTNIRKTRTAHNIITESSYRFEREIDPNLAELGAARAIELIKKYGGKNVKITAVADVYPKKIKPWNIKLDIAYVNSLLGENIPVVKMKNILENLGMRILGNLVSKLTIEVPTFRIDLKTQEDLIEEIGRIYGYENIKEQTPLVAVSTPMFNRKRELEDKIRDTMAGLGFSEVMNYSFYGADDIEKCNLKTEDHLEVANPMNPDQWYMRTSLIPGILKNVELNLKNFENFSIFEIGRIYLDPNAKIPDERTLLAGALVDSENKKNIFFSLKGKIEALFESLGIQNADFVEPKLVGSICHPKRSAVIKLKGKVIGYLCEINPQVLNEYKIKTRVAAFELNIADILDLASFQKEYESISKFPSVRRDISMFVPENITYARIKNEIKKTGEQLVKNIELFDIFGGSLAIRLEIGSDRKTMTSEEIDTVMQKIISALERELKVKVRK